MDVSKVGGEDMDWIKLVRNTDQQLVLVKAIINIRVPQNYFLVAERLSAFHERLYGKELFFFFGGVGLNPH
jgi:hypothetical protein